MEVYCFLSVYTLLMVIVVTLGGFFHRRKAFKNILETIPIEEVSVIIPFRNEIENLPRLLASFSHSTHLPKEVIFVDDHSNDGGSAYLVENAQLPSYKVLNLTKTFGKKAALSLGISEAKGRFVLTLDADVFFEPTYFSSIKNLPVADLWVLPVILTGATWKQHWQELDLHNMNAINVGLYGLYRPVIASGANLLFNKESFYKVGQYSSHAQFSSGDDTFLLRDFRDNHMDVRLLSSSALAVFTHSTVGILAFLNQRLRWISKTSRVKDHFATVLAILQTGFSLWFFWLLITCYVDANFMLCFKCYALKTLIDMVFFAPYYFRFNRVSSWVLFPLHQFIFPLYNLILVVLIPFYQSTWKGREVAR